jgi:two-component system LytT family response regulator
METSQLIRAVVVDDEPAAIATLTLMLNELCPHVEVVGTAGSVPEALNILRENPVDVLFLDISMPMLSGFELFSLLPQPAPDVILTTAYEQYALEAFKAGAKDYLLKPIDPVRLLESVQRVRPRPQPGTVPPPEPSGEGPSFNQGRLIVPNLSGFSVLEVRQILYLQADGPYSKILQEGGAELTASTSLSEFEAILPGTMFFRSHRSYLVNLYHVTSFDRSLSVLRMQNQHEIPLARNRKADLQQAISDLK